MTAGAVISGFTVLSSFTAVRFISPSNSPRRYGAASISLARRPEWYFLFSNNLFGTIAVVVAGAVNPLAFGKATVGQLELVIEASEEPAAEPAFSL
jgi:hypothetical protein